MTKLAWGVAIILAMGAVHPAHGKDAITKLPLDRDHHGIAGWVVLRTDARITPANRMTLQDYQWFGFGEPHPVQPPLAVQPLADAELRLEDKAGREVSSMPLGSPFAALSAVPLVPDRGSAFILEVANGGFGQFTGTIGRPFVIEAGRLRFLDATAPDGAPAGDITLMRAPRTGWLVLPASGNRPGEFFQASCLPGEGGADGFAEVLTAWRWDRQGWRRHQSTGRGYCSWAPGLPPLSSFP